LMTKYRIKNTAKIGKSYEAGNGKRMSFEPGEEKELGTLPPEVDDIENASGWEINEVGRGSSKSEEDEDEDEEVNE